MSERRRVVLTCIVCALAVVNSIVLFTAAALVPAPPAVLPLVVAVVIGGAMVAAWELRSTVNPEWHRKARRPLDERAADQLRRHLDELPETQHPLGL
jgi:CHASE2 domain-containing sensor protein